MFSIENDSTQVKSKPDEKNALKKTLLMGFAIGVFLAQPSQQAAAQGFLPFNFAGHDTQASSPGGEWKYKRNARHYQTTDLTSMPNFPGLPRYSGVKPLFMDGAHLPNTKTGPVYNVRLCTRESQQTVLNWYRKALQQYGWQMTEADGNNSVVSARKDKSICRVMVSPPSEPGSGASVIILYKQGRSDS